MNVKKCVRALLCLYLTLIIAMDAVKAQALKVGDTLPPELWNMPLDVINHPTGKETLTLSEYKDKLIILDFWATWCAPCVKSLAKLDTLQREFGEQLAVVPITYENADKVLPFLTKRAYQLPSVINDSTLKKYFPHRSVPHQVWVQDGNVLAVTGAEYGTKENISKALNKLRVQMVMKEEDMEFDAGKPLLIDGNGGGIEQLLYQSVFSKRVNANIGGWKFKKDGFAIYNCELRLHLLNAFSDHIDWSGRNNRILFELDSVTRLKLDYQYYKLHAQPSETETNRWLEENTYCYSLTLPAQANKKTILPIVRENLLVFIRELLGLNASLHTRPVLCNVISLHDPATSVAPQEGYNTTSVLSFFHNISYSNEHVKTPFVLAIPNEFAENRMITFPKDLDFKNKEEVKEILNRNGLVIKEEESLLSVVVVSPLKKNEL